MAGKSRHYQLRALTASHLQRAVFLLQLLQRFSELLPSLLFQSRAWKWKRGLEGLHPQILLIRRHSREEERWRHADRQKSRQTWRQTDRQVGRQTTMLSIISPGFSLSPWAHTSRAAHWACVSSLVRLGKSLTNEVQRFKAAIFQMTHSESVKLMYWSPSL